MDIGSALRDFFALTLVPVYAKAFGFKDEYTLSQVIQKYDEKERMEMFLDKTHPKHGFSWYALRTIQDSPMCTGSQ